MTVADSPASSSGAITVVVAVSFVRSQVQRTVKLRVSPSGWLTISASATAPVRAAYRCCTACASAASFFPQPHSSRHRAIIGTQFSMRTLFHSVIPEFPGWRQAVFGPRPPV